MVSSELFVFNCLLSSRFYNHYSVGIQLMFVKNENSVTSELGVGVQWCPEYHIHASLLQVSGLIAAYAMRNTTATCLPVSGDCTTTLQFFLQSTRLLAAYNFHHRHAVVVLVSNLAEYLETFHRSPSKQPRKLYKSLHSHVQYILASNNTMGKAQSSHFRCNVPSP